MIGGSLFTGIAGLDLGLEMAGAVTSWAWQCEKDPYALAVLERHYPKVHRYTDVRDVDGRATRVDLVCGGFPCQDVSTAGAWAGLTGERSGLWWEFRRVVRQLRPRYVFIENVHGGWRRWLPVVRRTLWRIGYASMPLRVRACDVGAPHRRARCFLLAYANGEQRRDKSRWTGGQGRSEAAVTSDHGAPGIAAYSDSDSWESRRSNDVCEGQGWRDPHRGNVDAGPPWIARDANRVRELQPGGVIENQWRWSRHADGWAFESPVPGVDDGSPNRLDRERALGNAVVPQQAALAWRELIARITT